MFPKQLGRGAAGAATTVLWTSRQTRVSLLFLFALFFACVLLIYVIPAFRNLLIRFVTFSLIRVTSVLFFVYPTCIFSDTPRYLV